MVRETPIKKQTDLDKYSLKGNPHICRSIDKKQFDELVEEWKGTKEFNSPWCTQLLWMEQVTVKRKQDRMFKQELDSQLSHLPEKGKTVTALDDNGIMYDCHVAKDGEVTVKNSENPEKKPLDVKYYLGGKKQFTYLSKTLTQWSHENKSPGVMNKIRRYVLRTISA